MDSSILFVELFRQSNYKTITLLSLIHKQKTYFSKKYSKSTRISLKYNKPNNLNNSCKNDNIKAIKYIYKTKNIIKYEKCAFKCVIYGCIKVVRFYTNNKFDITMAITISNNETHNFLSLCFTCGHINICKLMLNKYSCYCTSFCGPRSVLGISANCGNTDIVKYLLDNYAYGSSLTHALNYSISKGHETIAKLLLNKNAKPRNMSLYKCAKRGNVTIFKLLLNKMIQLNCDDSLNNSKLCEYKCDSFVIGVEYDNTDIVKLLLNDKDINKMCYNKAIDVCIREGHLDTLKLLLDKDGIDIERIYTISMLSTHKNIKEFVSSKIKKS